jgi:hypothetical protein
LGAGLCAAGSFVGALVDAVAFFDGGVLDVFVVAGGAV